MVLTCAHANARAHTHIHTLQNEEIIQYEEFCVMATASHTAGAVDDGTDAEVEAVFYSNVHTACTAALRPLGAAGV